MSDPRVTPDAILSADDFRDRWLQTLVLSSATAKERSDAWSRVMAHDAALRAEVERLTAECDAAITDEDCGPECKRHATCRERGMTSERDTAWRMYLEQLDETADAKTAHELAEARVAELTEALREYGRHDDACAIAFLPVDRSLWAAVYEHRRCDCGFAAVRGGS